MLILEPLTFSYCLYRNLRINFLELTYHRKDSDTWLSICFFSLQVVFRGGEGALQVLPPLVDVIPEARLNLVIYYLQQGKYTFLWLFHSFRDDINSSYFNLFNSFFLCSKM